MTFQMSNTKTEMDEDRDRKRRDTKRKKDRGPAGPAPSCFVLPSKVPDGEQRIFETNRLAPN